MIHICLNPSSNLETMFSFSSSFIRASMRERIFNPMKDWTALVLSRQSVQLDLMTPVCFLGTDLPAL